MAFIAPGGLVVGKRFRIRANLRAKPTEWLIKNPDDIKRRGFVYVFLARSKT
jgi:hypothetical protein